MKQQIEEWTAHVLPLVKRVGWVLFLLPGEWIAWWEYPSRRERRVGPTRRGDPRVTHFVVTTLLYAFLLFLYAVLAPHGGVAPAVPTPDKGQEVRPNLRQPETKAPGPSGAHPATAPQARAPGVKEANRPRKPETAKGAPAERAEPKPAKKPPYPADLAKIIDPSDWRYVRRALDAASRSGGTSPHPWRNPANGHRGFVTDTGLAPDPHGCRQFRVTRNTAGHAELGFVDKCGDRVRP